MSRRMIPPEMNISNPFIHRTNCAGPIELIGLLSESLPHFIRRHGKIRPEYSFPSTTISDLAGLRLSRTAIATVVSLAILFTLLRYILQNAFKRRLREMAVFPRYEHKLPETIWKMFLYGSAWLFSLYVYTQQPNVFDDPLTMWNGWSSGQAPPTSWQVEVVYATQAAFYLHSIYATLFMDLWRKDSWLMFFHHFVALALLLLSYVDGFVFPGILLVFLHDNTDAALEMAKLGTYLKKRSNGMSYPAWNVFGNVCFVGFAIMWVVFRLYWYPGKLLYATLYGAVYLAPQDAPFFPLLGTMLTLIYVMNLYWFNFIARMVIRVAVTGQEPEDNREWDTTVVSGLDKKKLDTLRAMKQQ